MSVEKTCIVYEKLNKVLKENLMSHADLIVPAEQVAAAAAPKQS